MAGGNLEGQIQVVLSAPGFHTHGSGMTQRMVMMTFTGAGESTLNVTSPRDESVMPPGVYLLFIVENGIPSEGVWIQLSS